MDVLRLVGSVFYVPAGCTDSMQGSEDHSCFSASRIAKSFSGLLHGNSSTSVKIGCPTPRLLALAWLAQAPVSSQEGKNWLDGFSKWCSSLVGH